MAAMESANPEYRVQIRTDGTWGKDGVTYYNIEVTQHSNSKQWLVQRRYREFHALHATLRTQRSDINWPDLPEKSVFRSRLDQKFRGERAEGLRAFLSEVLSADPSLQRLPGVPEFLKIQRCKRFTSRLGDEVEVKSGMKIQEQPAVFEAIEVTSGSANLACELGLRGGSKPPSIGLVVAANSGRPGGACGLHGAVQKIHPNHRTQEEDIISSWMLTEAGRSKYAQDKLFAATIDRQWGMVNMNSTDQLTLQNINYCDTTDAQDYADAWLVHNAKLCAKINNAFDTSVQTSCSLVFASGPNAGAVGDPQGSTARTLNKLASQPGEYTFFRECVKATFRAALNAMAVEGVEVAILAQISGGIYGGPHRDQIQRDYPEIINELLREPLGSSTRGHFFERVILPRLPATQVPHADAVPSAAQPSQLQAPAAASAAAQPTQLERSRTAP